MLRNGRNVTEEKTRIRSIRLISIYLVLIQYGKCSRKDLLLRIKSVAGPVSSSYTYNNMVINSESLERGIALYQTGIDKFLGNSLIKRLENTRFKSNNDLQEKLTPDKSSGNGEWVDLAGLIAPRG